MKPTIAFMFGILAPVSLCHGAVTFVQTVGMGLAANATDPNVISAGLTGTLTGVNFGGSPDSTIGGVDFTGYVMTTGSSTSFGSGFTVTAGSGGAYGFRSDVYIPASHPGWDATNSPDLTPLMQTTNDGQAPGVAFDFTISGLDPSSTYTIRLLATGYLPSIPINNAYTVTGGSTAFAVGTGQLAANNAAYGQPHEGTYSDFTITGESSFNVIVGNPPGDSRVTIISGLIVSAIPEPSSALLVGLTSCVFLLRRRRWRECLK